MKIERGSITITDIPYFDSIEVMPSGVLLTRGASEQSFHLAEIEAIRDALTEAIRIKRETDGTSVNASPRVFRENDAEPGPKVTKVRDKDGSIWYRSGKGWSLSIDGYVDEWFVPLQYAPLTDVTDE